MAMRLDNIRLSWFRGSAEEVKLDLDSKNVVVYGSNGSGKSTFVDGLEYIIRNGRISHLSHEYSGRRQEKGIRNTHTPQGVESSVTVTFEDDSYLVTEIEPNGAFSISSEPPELQSVMQRWPLENHLLRQDEVANFVHLTKGQKYSVLLPLLGLDNLEYASNNVKDLLRAINDQSKIELVRSKIGYLSERTNRYFQSDEYEVVLNGLKELAKKYGIGVSENINEISSNLLLEINRRIDEIKPENDRYVILNQAVEERLDEKIENYNAFKEKVEGLISVLIDQRLSVLESTKNFVEALTDLEEEITCPSCGQKVLGKDLAQHVLDELVRLDEVRALRNAANNALEILKNGHRRALTSFRRTELKTWLEDVAQKELAENIEKMEKINIDEIESIQDEYIEYCDLIPSLLELIRAEIAIAPPTVRDLIADQIIVQVGRTLHGINTLKDYLVRVVDLIEVLQTIDGIIKEETRKKTEQVLESISENILSLWSKLHPNEPIEGIHLYIPDEADRAIDIALNFFGVDQPSPRLTLSESHRNCIGLCIFLALALQRADPDNPIVLDDIVSSLDRGHRGMLVDIFLEDLRDRQILLLTHDREWYSELRTRLPASDWKFLVLSPWDNPSVGIRWSRSQYTFDDARQLLSTIPESAGNRARAIMDGELALAAEKLKLPLPYLRGDRNDHRTCVDFLSRIIGEAPRRLKRIEGSTYVPYSEPLDDWKTTHKLLIAWGDRASHAGTLTQPEAERLIEYCERALEHFKCQSCGEYLWIADQTGRERLQCACGEIQWRYK